MPIEPKYYVCHKLDCAMEEMGILFTREVKDEDLKCPVCSQRLTLVAKRNYSPTF